MFAVFVFVCVDFSSFFVFLFILSCLDFSHVLFFRVCVFFFKKKKFLVLISFIFFCDV